uniref:Uncharacterized protein n=1 Tax=Amphimedon queenslandica TaxID=400682 RepID=A0A1X7TJC6_AMPQE
MWGGFGSGVDYDVIEVYDLPTGAWDQKPTTGTPPQRTWGYSSVAIGKDIYYFGGHGVGGYENSLHCFNVDSFKWRELSPSSSDRDPMKKGYCGIISVHLDSEDYLVIIGGLGSSSTPKQPNAQYNNSYGNLRCNEIHYYRISSDQWISPVVTGDRPPPIESFTLTPVTNNTAVMFGGETDNGWSNKLFMISFTKTSVDIFEIPNPGGSVQWPKGRWGHSSVLITTSSGPHLLVVGGLHAYDVWLLNINKRKWKELINVPHNVTRRLWHSLSVWSVTPTTNWIYEFGGGAASYSTDTAVIELRCTSDNDWSTSVIPLDQYQDQLRRRILSDWENLGFTKEVQLLRDCLQDRTKMEFSEEQLQRDVKGKEELSRRLHDATTLLHQAEKNNAYLRNSLELCNKQLEQKNLEDEQLRQELRKQSEIYEKLEAKIANKEVYITEILREEKIQVEEKEQIITEDYEKLKLKVADMEEQYLIDKEKQIIIDDNQNLISEKDKVIAKLTSQAEEQSQNEKQIITDLKEKELYIAKLVKERQERVLKQPIKETSSIGLQFNYLIPSMDSLDSSVVIAGQKLFILQGDRSHSLQWEKYGFRLECPQGAVSKDTEVAVTALAGGNFKVPKGTVLVSAVYAISVSKALLKPLVIELQHCVDLRKTSQTGCLKFVRAPLKSPNAYQFSIVEGGSFSVGNRYGSIERDEFCAFGIGYVGNGDTPNGGGNGSENDTQAQGTNNDSEEETNGDTPNDSSNGAGENSSGGGATPSTSTTPPHDSINDDPSQLVHEVESHTTDEPTVQQSDHVLSDSDGPTATVSSEQRPAMNDDESSTDHSTAQSGNDALSRDTLYSGMMYYDKKEAGYWKAMYSVVRDLEVLKTYLESKQASSIEYDDVVDSFKFIEPNGTLELTLHTVQQVGWTVDPIRNPMKLFQSRVDQFPLTPSYATCSIS